MKHVARDKADRATYCGRPILHGDDTHCPPRAIPMTDIVVTVDVANGWLCSICRNGLLKAASEKTREKAGE